jgi:phospholipase/carboxylesterase
MLHAEWRKSLRLFAMPLLPALEICPGSAPSASVIWLHGLGADGYDFAPVVEALQPLPHIRFILPHAPEMPVTINNGYVMPAWYDLLGLTAGAAQDEAGIRASQRRIEDVIANEITRGIASERILLAGFSQGGAIALHTGLRHGARLAGIMALSTYLPLQHCLEGESSPANHDLPIFMAHGNFDTVIPLPMATASRDRLLAKGYPVEWHEYPMPHSVSEEEIADIRHFLLRALPEN